jgi:hypothetical protein
MKRLAQLCLPALALLLASCGPLPPQADQAVQAVQAKPLAHKTVAAVVHHAPKPEPTQQELFDYVRGKLLALSSNDDYNDNQEVSFDPATSIMSVTQPDGRCDIFLGSIDTNSMLWEIYDPSDSFHERPKVLRLTLTSLSGQKARTCYDSHNQVDPTVPGNRARLLFSLQKAEAVSDFQENMNKAIKKLVIQAGGEPEKKLF